MVEKELKVKISTLTDIKDLEDLESKLKELQDTKLKVGLDADTTRLEEVSSEIEDTKSTLSDLKGKVDVDNSELESLESELSELEAEQLQLMVNIEDTDLDDVDEKAKQMDDSTVDYNVNVEGEEGLDEIQSKKDAIEDDPINVKVDNLTAMAAISEIADGFGRIKSAALEVGQQFGDILASAGKQETNFKFLENAVGNAELARQKMSEINDIVAQLPGDDTALQGLLSSAAAKDSSLTADNLRSMANSATDYFSAMSYYGKSATEAQQDMTNYLLAGNTAELERSPILQGHIDKLKEANTVQERSKALAEALNEEHWGGMGAMDTYNNKLETFNGMLERGKYNLGGVFQEGAKSAMDFLIKLDGISNGLVGMTIAAGGFLSPITEGIMGLGQMATGLKSLKEAADFTGITGKLKQLKGTLLDVGAKARGAAKAIGRTLWNALKSAATGAKDAAIWIGRTSKELLISAGNAMKSAAAFLWDAGTKAAQTVATKAAAIAQEFLNLVMSMNPIILVVAAIIALIAILWYLYNTNEDVRKAIDGFINTLKNIGETIYGSLKGAFEWLQGAWQNTVDWFNNGVNSIVSAFNTFSQAVQDTAQWIWDSLIAVLEYLQGAWQNTVDFFTNGGQTIQDALGGVFQWLQDAFNNVITFFQTYGPLIAEVLFVMATGGIGAIILLIGQFNGMPSTIGAILQNIITRVINFGSSLVSNFINSAKTSVTNFMNQISSLPAKLKGELDNMLSAVDRWAATLPQKFWEAGVNAVKNFLNALGIHSPGFMAVNFSQELKRMEDSANNNNIASNIGATASNILDKWGDPSLDIEVNGHDGGVTGNVEFLLRQLIELLSNQKASGDFTFNLYGDVDSEERMEKFLDYVIRATEWDNDTAGRGV